MPAGFVGIFFTVFFELFRVKVVWRVNKTGDRLDIEFVSAWVEHHPELWRAAHQDRVQLLVYVLGLGWTMQFLDAFLYFVFCHVFFEEYKRGV